jgi:hypothetical protein
MIEAGFEDVVEINYRWPSNQWSDNEKEKLLGAWTQAQIKGGMLESVSTRLFMSKLGWSKEELERFLTEVKRDTADSKIRAYSPMSVHPCVSVIDADRQTEWWSMGENLVEASSFCLVA